jgi:hypothetical protein
VAEPETLRRLYVRIANHPLEPGMILQSFSYSAFSAVEGTEGDAYDAIAWIPSQEETIRDGDRQVPVRTSFVSHDYFSVLGVGAARGRLFGDDEVRVDVPAPVAVIGHSLWDRAFGLDPSVIGRTIRLASADVTIVGVAEEGFLGLELSYADVFLPLGAFQGSVQQTGAWYEQTGSYLRAAAKLGPAADDARASERATAGYLRRRLPTSDRRGIDSPDVVLMGPVIETRGLGRRTGTEDRRQAVAVSARTIGVSSLLLLIACTNVATLLLVRASTRRREICGTLGSRSLSIAARLPTHRRGVRPCGCRGDGRARGRRVGWPSAPQPSPSRGSMDGATHRAGDAGVCARYCRRRRPPCRARARAPVAACRRELVPQVRRSVGPIVEVRARIRADRRAGRSVSGAPGRGGPLPEEFLKRRVASPRLRHGGRGVRAAARVPSGVGRSFCRRVAGGVAARRDPGACPAWRSPASHR